MHLQKKENQFLLLTLNCIPNYAKASVASGLNAYIINVGHGDCILLQQGTTYALIDTGDSSHWTQVNDFLERKGVQTLEYLIITHYDPDHCPRSNVGQICSNYTVNHIVMRELGDTQIDALRNDNTNIPGTTEYQKSPKYGENCFLRYSYLLGKGIDLIHDCYDGKTLPLGNANIEFYNREISFIDDANPKFDSVGLSTRINLDSLVFKATYGDTSMFFTGDVGKAGCEYVTDNHSASELQSDFYKISHHGYNGNNTENLIKAVSPSIAFNSEKSDYIIGTYSSFSSTYTYLKNEDAKIYQTHDIASYVNTTYQDYDYTALMVIASGVRVKAFAVYKVGESSCNRVTITSNGL